MTLPAAPVTTVEKVKTWAGITGTTHDLDLADIVAAVDEFVRGLESVARIDASEAGWPIVESEPAWPNRFSLGAKMLAARLNRRKNSPEVVATFTGEGAAYVRRNDPDVAAMLRMNLPVAG